MNLSNADFNKKTILIGYWAGGICCVLALFSLALGLSPLISNFKKNLITTRCPGGQMLDLESPGLYTGVGTTKGLSHGDAQKVKALEYSLTDTDGQEIQPFIKVPRQQYALDKESDQLPLFQFEVLKKGKYFLNSNYPYNMEGPNIQVFLFHSDLNYTRMELFVGILLFFMFAGLGFYLIRKSNVASRPAKLKT